MNRYLRNINLLIQSVCIAVVPLLLPPQAWGDGSQQTDSHTITNNLSAKDLLDAIHEKTGYRVEVVGGVPRPQITTAPNDFALPQDIDRLAIWLGIDSYAAKIDTNALTINLQIVSAAHLGNTSDLNRSFLEVDQRPIERLPSEDPYLAPAEADSVSLFYEQLQGELPDINTDITQEDKQRMEEEIPSFEPYLTTDDEESLISFYNQLQHRNLDLDNITMSDHGPGQNRR